MKQSYIILTTPQTLEFGIDGGLNQKKWGIRDVARGDDKVTMVKYVSSCLTRFLPRRAWTHEKLPRAPIGERKPPQNRIA